MICKDVTKGYVGYTSYQRGEVVFECGYRKNNHFREIQMAMWLNDMLGDDIVLLTEVNADRQKTADYLWRGKLWELKTMTTAKAADSAVRYGLKQIRENVGGIILDYRAHKLSLKKLCDVLDRRMRHGQYDMVDIMVVCNWRIAVVFRYMK